MKKTIFTALSAVGVTLTLSGAAQAGKIYTGGAHGAYNSDFCPQLSAELAKAKFNYNCTPTLGSTENLAKVKESPSDIGYSQFDVFTLDTTTNQPAQPHQIIRTDVARECLFMVTKNKDLKSFGDVAGQANSLHFILPPKGSGSASTFEYLRRVDPDGLGRAAQVSHAETTDIALQQALDDEKAVSLFVQFPDPDSDRFKMINKAGGFFVPVIDRNILRQQVGDQKIYFAQETEVKNAKFWKKGETVITACTPMVVFTGNPDLMSTGEQKLEQTDLIKTVNSIPLENLQPKEGFLSRYWSKTRALSADAVEKMMEATEKAREKAAPLYEQAKEKAKELGEKAAPMYEQAKEKAKELGGKALDKAKELGDAAKEKLNQQQQ